MLYPKEDRENQQLMFACRTCEFSEPAASSCVFRNTLYNEVGETAGVTQDVGSDPTVGIPESELDFDPTCTLCGDRIKCEVCGELGCSSMVGTSSPGHARSQRSNSDSEKSTESEGVSSGRY